VDSTVAVNTTGVHVAAAKSPRACCTLPGIARRPEASLSFI